MQPTPRPQQRAAKAISRALTLVPLIGLGVSLGWLALASSCQFPDPSALAALTSTGTTQPSRVPRIGYLGSLAPDWPAPLGPPRTEIFREGLREQGYIEGQNIIVEYRFAEGKFERLADLAAELVSLPVDLIVLADARATRYARAATSTIPLVMVLNSDPVQTGYVSSLDRPGGNITGLTISTVRLDAKRLELLTELVPHIKRVGVLWERNDIAEIEWRGAEEAATALGIELLSFEIQGPHEIEDAIARMAEDGAQAVLVFGTVSINAHSPAIAELAKRHSLPLVGPNVDWVQAGALMTYVPDFPHMYRQAAAYVRRILNGADPAVMSIEQPSRFDLAINLATAEALGLDIPRSIRIRATEVVR